MEDYTQKCAKNRRQLHWKPDTELDTDLDMMGSEIRPALEKL